MSHPMWRWAGRTLTVISGLLAIAACVGAGYQAIVTRKDLAAHPPPGRLVDIGGHRLHLWCTGSGAPAVILESGLGSSTPSWGFVQPEVARFTRVCSYDRAGLGYSDPGPSPRTARRIAHELALLVDQGGVGDSVVLVGASFGGLTVRVFASEHPQRAAGLVLVDASHEDQPHDVPGLAPFVPLLSAVGLFRVLGVSFGLSPDSLAPSVRGFAHATRFRTAAHRAAADEIIHIHDTAAEVRATRRKLTIPVVVVTAGRGSDAAWRDLQRDQVGLSERRCQVIAEESSHTVALDQPQVVVAAIRAVVEAASGRKDVDLCASPGGG